ncbi:hypothetical protein MKD41_07205 [Lutibacter sp. A64]|uniref:hypothetical protein n=1 Tax=Lutibacter sp. A64 TaxID=2918526 RepID=UPI001F054C1B|nr:hypothetical protein [Lutibacter sp. A64]UMB55252.1 hypothetical protein MKD41_07205 [Lutibacter sp. A64]
MKNLKTICYLILIFIAIPMYSQENCKVLKKDINSEYSGECSKGLAHGIGIAKGINTYEGQFKKGLPSGKGTITYADGSSYTGEWKKGERSGEGKFIITSKGKDSIVDGLWKKDKYVGKKKVKEFDVIKKIAVSRYTIRKISDKGNQVTVRVKNNGMYVATTSNINGSSGNLVFSQGRAIFENITSYPFTCDMNYETPSKIGTTSYTVEFRFKILVEGDWLVELYH